LPVVGGSKGIQVCRRESCLTLLVRGSRALSPRFLTRLLRALFLRRPWLLVQKSVHVKGLASASHRLERAASQTRNDYYQQRLSPSRQNWINASYSPA